jgi:Pyruvate/2-oxoacid:ferredoxin oxidoreductase delta subunit
MTPLQAQMVAELPLPPRELADKFGLELETVQRELDGLFHKGVIGCRDLDTRQDYRLPQSVDMFYFLTLTATHEDKSYESELVRLWDDFCYEEWYPRLAEEYSQKPHPEERVIPARKALEGIPGVHPAENMAEILKAPQATAVVDCPCRRQARKCEGALDTCFMFDKMAEGCFARGAGKRVSYEEALALTDKAEEEGQVHVWINSSFMGSRFMCNCCQCCCIDWAPLLQHNVPLEKRWAKSRFEARVDQALCDGCQTCVERCQFDAIEMQRVPGSKRLKASVNPEKCFGCGVCVLKCEPGALSLKMVRPLEHIPGLVPA